MRTKGLTAVLLLLIVVLTAACGSSGEATPTQQPDSGTNQQSANDGAGADNAGEDKDSTGASEKRTVESLKGPIEIPADPQRVIGLSVVYPEFLYTLGIVPVAVQNYHEDFPSYLLEPFKDTVKMGIAKTPPFESIMLAEPDLILAPVWWADKDYDQLSKIAPTVLLPEREDWRDELRDIAAIFGKEEQAEGIIADLVTKEVVATKQLDELVGDETVLYMRIMAKEIVLHGENLSRGGLVHKQLGLKPVEGFPQEERGISISMEVLPDYDADHIIVQLDNDDDEEIKKRFQEMSESSLWSNLTAVKNGHVYMVGGKEWFNVGMSPLADSNAIDELVEAFREKNTP